MASALQAGAARALITPPLGLYLTGWPQPRLAQGIHQDLWIKSVAFRDGAETALLLALDNLFLREAEDRALRARLAAATGVPPGQIMLAATHTHSAPLLSPLAMPGAPAPDAAYRAQVFAAAEESARGALAALAPVAVRRGWGSYDLGVNRRAHDADGAISFPPRANPQGAVDRAVSVARLDRADGSPVVVLFCYGCHPTVWGPNTLVSPDYPGTARQVVEAALDGKTEAVFLLGCAGNVRSNYLLPDGRFDWDGRAERVEAAGRGLGEEVVRAAQAAEPVQGSGLRAASEEVWLAFPPALNAPPVPALFQSLRVGSLLLIGSPAETFAETGLAVKAALRGDPFVVSCANGVAGYVPTAEAYAQGGYEVERWPEYWRYPAAFAPETEQQFVAAMLRTAKSAGGQPR